MTYPILAAYFFSMLTALTVLFQLALAAGAPWGEMAMGGKYPGRFPPSLRVAAVVQALLLLCLALIVLTRAGLMFPGFYAFSTVAIWFVVAFCALSAVLNSITPSKKERRLWAPVTIVLLLCAIAVAVN
ncbi:hypothetical protein ACFOSD_06880 [Salinispirillum marinum]|uniref:Uncharacterized protein n=2 Tax=Saccharospirillaceae TaxID=255527 RepID=A0ABV8BCI3_9GAMM